MRKSGKVLAVLLVAAGVLAGCGGGEKQTKAGDASYKVGIVQQVEHPALDNVNKGFVEALDRRLPGKVAYDQQNAQGDQSNLTSINSRFISDKKDLILAIGTPAAQSAAGATKEIPVVASAVYDFVRAKIVDSLEKPGGNVTGTTNYNPVEKQIHLIMKVVPDVKRVGLIYSNTEINSQLQAESFKEYAATKGIEVVEEVASNVNEVQQAAQNLVNRDIQAVYAPTDNVVASTMATVIGVTDDAKLPVFVADGSLLKFGALASYTVDFYKLGLQAGEMAADILEGKSKPADMPVQPQDKMGLVVNEEQAKKLGITIPSDLPKEAS